MDDALLPPAICFCAGGEANERDIDTSVLTGRYDVTGSLYEADGAFCGDSTTAIGFSADPFTGEMLTIEGGACVAAAAELDDDDDVSMCDTIGAGIDCCCCCRRCDRGDWLYT